MVVERGFLMSASTEGEERWGEVNTTESEDNILLPAHSYTILLVADVKAYKLLKIRNLWGQFEWYALNNSFQIGLEIGVQHLLYGLQS